jgi:hypothetical protein
MYNLLYCCEALDSLFRRFGIKYYFWGMGIDHKLHSYIPQKFKEYFKKFNWLEDYPSWQYERISLADQHPNFQGHKDLANIMFSLMNNPASRSR